MTRLSRLMVLLALAGVLVTPLATAHPIATHLYRAGETGLSHELRNLAVMALLMLLGASLIPGASATRIVLVWLRDSHMLHRIHGGAERRKTDEGTEYLLLATPGVHFFTAGLVRSRIYATLGALEQLDPLAFRAAILHEREHQRRHHVAWRLALAALETAFRPVAPVRRAVAALALECEFAADRAALAAGADRLHLFDAVVAASGSASRQPVAGLSGMGTLQRLEALASPGQHHRSSGMALVWVVAGLSAAPLLAHLLVWLGAVCL